MFGVQNTPGEHQVFISYSSVNKSVADAICGRLESGGIKCWYAPRDITPGVHWQGAIMEAIRKAKVFILVYSKESNLSIQVLNEITNACQERCVIIPFRIDNSKMRDELAFYLNAVHWLDASLPPMENKLNRLYEYVCNVLRGSSGKKKSKTWLVALILSVVVCAAACFGIARYYRNQPQSIDLNCVSQARGYYPYDAYTMISTDGKYICIQNGESGLTDIIRLRDGKVLLAGLEFVPKDPMKALAVFHEASKYFYFIEHDTGALKIYCKDTQSWVVDTILQELIMEENEHPSACSFNENMASVNQYVNHALILVYNPDPQVDCYTKVILLAPDGSCTARDIGELGLQAFVAGFELAECYDILFLDREDHLRVLDPIAGVLTETNHQRIRLDYLPYADGDSRILSPGARYLHSSKLNPDNSMTEIVWSLESGYQPFCETVDWGMLLHFSAEDEIIYFNKDECTLYTKTLPDGLPTKLLNNGYFFGNDAFLESVYAFYYAEQYEACFFMSASGVQSGNDVFIRMTVTDRQGKVLAVSDDIQLPNIPFSSMMEVQDGFVELICFADEAIFRRDTTVVWSAAYSEDGQGNLVFEDN